MPGGVNVAVGLPAESSPDPQADPAMILQHLRSHVAARIPGAADLDGLWDVRSGRPFLWPMIDVRAPAITALDDRVALCGDSGMGFLPTAGVGASNALRSAAALAYDLSLADATTAPLAIARWRDRVGDLVRHNQDDSRRLAKVMMVRRRSASAAVNAVMRHMPVSAMTRDIVKSMDVPF
jgi:2-polyprenyl-6-methoxyphenol hydroxylase-like FAD-dependent oxidoreductase